MKQVQKQEQMQRPTRYVKTVTCACGTTSQLNFHCIACCLRWLNKMDRATMAINAPVIGLVAGQAHLQAVREAYQAQRKL